MKVLFIGLGSIGKRHVKNLRKAAAERKLHVEIHAHRTFEAHIADEIFENIEMFRNIEDLHKHYDIVFITNPTALHFQTITQFGPICDHMFIEKPVFEHPDYPLDEMLKLRKGCWYVAAPIRYTEVYKCIKSSVADKHDVNAARIICSSYMPEWQKGRDYRKSFRTSSALGGGVDIDLVHEIDYMVDLFGLPVELFRVAGKYSKLEMETCDLASYIFSYPDFVVEMHLDYFGRDAKREIEIFTNDDVIVGDFLKRNVRFKYAGAEKEFSMESDHYFEEMKCFLDMVTGKAKNSNPPELAIKILSLAKGKIPG